MTNEPQKTQGSGEEILIPEFYETVADDQKQIVVENLTINVTINNSAPPLDTRIIGFLNSQKASWIFGGGLLLLVVWLLLAGPDHLVPYKLMMLGHLVGLCAGFLAFFLSGQLGLEIHSLKDDIGKLALRAVGGMAIYALALFIWVNPWFGVMNADKPSPVPAQQTDSSQH